MVALVEKEENSDAVALAAVKVATLCGEPFEVLLPETATIRAAKDAIQERLGIPTIEQRLVLGSVILDDDLPVPFADMTKADLYGQPLQLMRVAQQHLPEFLVEHGLSVTGPRSLEHILTTAATHDNAQVCLEIIRRDDFLADDENRLPRSELIRCLVQGGLFEAFQELLEHPGYGGRENLLENVGIWVLRDAAKRGLPLHCKSILQCPKISAKAATFGEGVGDTPLHHAANEQIQRLLLDDPAAFLANEAVNALDRKGCTCLHYASTEIMCRTVLEHPSFMSVNVANATGQTALHTAGSPGACVAILQHPDFTALNVQDQLGRTALHYAVRSEVMGLALLHAAKDLDVDIVDSGGRTALHYAGTGAVCRALFEAGFQAVGARDRGVPRDEGVGVTALVKAVQNRRDDVVLAILEATAGHALGNIGAREAADLAASLGLDAEIVRALEVAAAAEAEGTPAAETESCSRRWCVLL